MDNLKKMEKLGKVKIILIVVMILFVFEIGSSFLCGLFNPFTPN